MSSIYTFIVIENLHICNKIYNFVQYYGIYRSRSEMGA